MADQVVVPTKEEEVPQEVKEYREMHNAPIAAIIADTNKQEEPKEEVKEEPKVEEPKKEEPKSEPPKEEPKVDTEAIARKAAEEVLAKAKAEEEKKQAEEKAKADAEKRKLEGRPKWEWDNDPKRPKDESGKPLPYSYEEVAEEGRRLGKEDAIQEWQTRETAKAAEQEAARKQEETRNAEIKQAQDNFNKQLQSELDADLSDLYTGNKLPKIQDPNNPNDEGVLARNALFQAGVKVNKERADKGLPPIRSIKVIYYEHYKAPTKQPAGANAPVMGNAAPPAKPIAEDEYDWAKDHFKSPQQLLHELKQKVKGVKN